MGLVPKILLASKTELKHEKTSLAKLLVNLHVKILEYKIIEV